MGKRQKGVRSSASAVEDVLAGRLKPDVGLLLTLIRDVNPTARSLPAEEARSRYAAKSRLQSLLLQLYEAEFPIERDGTDTDLLSLRHVSGIRDACHTRLSELEPEVRAPRAARRPRPRRRWSCWWTHSGTMPPRSGWKPA